MKGDRLGEFEELTLLAVCAIRGETYGVPVQQFVEKATGRNVTMGAVYAALARLEDKGYVTSAFSDPTPERGGRSKRYFKVKPLGLRTLRASREALTAMWEGLEPLVRRGT